MQDTPNHTEILSAVAVLLRETIMPLLSGQANYQVRVAANALDLVNRQTKLQLGFEADELASLKSLLGVDGTLEALNVLLCERIERRSMTLETPGVVEHLWATIAKLAVDQPNYARYQRELAG